MKRFCSYARVISDSIYHLIICFLMVHFKRFGTYMVLKTAKRNSNIKGITYQLNLMEEQ